MVTLQVKRRLLQTKRGQTFTSCLLCIEVKKSVFSMFLASRVLTFLASRVSACFQQFGFQHVFSKSGFSMFLESSVLACFQKVAFQLVFSKFLASQVLACLQQAGFKQAGFQQAGFQHVFREPGFQFVLESQVSACYQRAGFQPAKFYHLFKASLILASSKSVLFQHPLSPPLAGGGNVKIVFTTILPLFLTQPK